MLAANAKTGVNPTKAGAAIATSGKDLESNVSPRVVTSRTIAIKPRTIQNRWMSTSDFWGEGLGLMWTYCGSE
jgi:hypothetical protein